MEEPAPRHVLVVDDDPDARDILAQIVTKLNIEVRTACDGAEALSQIRSAPPLAVLLDLMMPHVDGFDILADMRSNPATCDTPVIVITACSTENIPLLKMPGIFEVIQKGQMSPHNMLQLIQDAIDRTPDR